VNFWSSVWRNLRGEGRRRPDGVVSAPVLSFQRDLDVPFREPDLLRHALTHRSFLGSNGGDPNLSNERLEFLGDAVLELIVVEYLYSRFPEDREGDLTKKKGLLVSREILSRCARELRLGDYLLLSGAEREAGGQGRASILADGLEAVIGAIYLDQGFPAVERFVHRHLLDQADSIVGDPTHHNFKSQLQEIVQARYRTHPRYSVVTEVGPDHRKLFTVDVKVRGQLLGRGQGYNKKEAEQSAAHDALGKLPAEGPIALRIDAQKAEPAGDIRAASAPRDSNESQD